MASLYALLLLLLFSFSWRFCSADDILKSSQFLQDNQSIVSKNGTFKLGFFSPPNSANRYLGIWFNKVPVMTVVWIANRDKPITDSSGVLKLSDNGNLQLLYGQNKTIWSTNSSNLKPINSTAQLLDTGNLVIQEANSNDIIWQCFDHPTNTLLPGMKPTVPKTPNKKNIIFQSWKSPSDPSIGNFSTGIGTNGLPQIFTWNNGVPYWRSGPFDGGDFIGINNVDMTLNDGFVLEDNPENGTLDISFSPQDVSLLLNYFVDVQGTIIEQYWDDANKNWTVGFSVPSTECDVYGKCGTFGTCNQANSPICECLKGFEPKNEDEWKKENWSSGCVRSTRLQCGTQGGKQDVFLNMQKMKVPDNIERLAAFSQENCENQCLNNCSCLAYAYHLKMGCMTWSNDLIDIQELSGGGIDFFLRLASSELEEGKSHKKTAIIASVTVIGALLMVAIFIYLLMMQMTRRGMREQHIEHKFGDNICPLELKQAPVYAFEILKSATNNFHDSNKLGQGGFGPVYKGILEDGQEIAVKRLSRTSGQGLEEFMNEVVVIFKLQHRNLVRLLGCCVEGDEKMLVYEYMPNRSLDAFLFDPLSHELLPWKKRFSIIKGICRGLLYLHRDSRLRIIHRDLKASNILLDEDLNPKISDFGMARIFGGDQVQANTNRVVGTYGYMSPEYTMGQFSEKSDVYSFGVILLEIITGKRNTNFHHKEQSLTLLGHAWKLWNEDKVVSLIDPTMSDSSSEEEIVKCIQMGLLCVQELPSDRPNISTVISMLETDIENLPLPKKPPFTEWEASTDDQQTKSTSTNNYSTSILQGR